MANNEITQVAELPGLIRTYKLGNLWCAEPADYEGEAAQWVSGHQTQREAVAEAIQQSHECWAESLSDSEEIGEFLCDIIEDPCASPLNQELARLLLVELDPDREERVLAARKLAELCGVATPLQ